MTGEAGRQMTQLDRGSEAPGPPTNTLFGGHSSSTQPPWAAQLSSLPTAQQMTSRPLSSCPLSTTTRGFQAAP